MGRALLSVLASSLVASATVSAQTHHRWTDLGYAVTYEYLERSHVHPGDTVRLVSVFLNAAEDTAGISLGCTLRFDSSLDVEWQPYQCPRSEDVAVGDSVLMIRKGVVRGPPGEYEVSMGFAGGPVPFRALEPHEPVQNARELIRLPYVLHLRGDRATALDRRELRSVIGSLLSRSSRTIAHQIAPEAVPVFELSSPVLELSIDDNQFGMEISVCWLGPRASTDLVSRCKTLPGTITGPLDLGSRLGSILAEEGEAFRSTH